MSEVDEVESSVSVKFIMTLSWFEKRLTYHNLKENFHENIIPSQIADEMWIPSLIFTNQDDRY